MSVRIHVRRQGLKVVGTTRAEQRWLIYADFLEYRRKTQSQKANQDRWATMMRRRLFEFFSSQTTILFYLLPRLKISLAHFRSLPLFPLDPARSPYRSITQFTRERHHEVMLQRDKKKPLAASWMITYASFYFRSEIVTRVVACLKISFVRPPPQFPI